MSSNTIPLNCLFPSRANCIPGAALVSSSKSDDLFISAFPGFESLSMILKELEQKGVPGKILTTDYLTFSQPKALDRLAQLKNIELKMFRTNSEVGGFHTKGYISRR